MSDDEPSRIGRVMALVAVAAMAVMWVYIFSGVAREDPPDRLDDDGYASAAEPICAAALEDIEALPSASASSSAADRADVLDEANLVLTEMVDELEALPTTTARDAELTEAWIADWRTYLEDRDEYATALRDDPDAELLVTARGNRQITVTIDNFAEEANAMPSCATPLDA